MKLMCNWRSTCTHILVQCVIYCVSAKDDIYASITGLWVDLTKQRAPTRFSWKGDSVHHWRTFMNKFVGPHDILWNDFGGRVFSNVWFNWRKFGCRRASYLISFQIAKPCSFKILGFLAPTNVIYLSYLLLRFTIRSYSWLQLLMKSILMYVANYNMFFDVLCICLFLLE